MQKTELGRQHFYHLPHSEKREREQERARQPDQEPKGDDYVVIQRDSFYYLKNQSADLERQVDVLRKINEYERFIDGICLGLDVSGSFRGSDSRREGKSRWAVALPGVCTGKQSTLPSEKRQHQDLEAAKLDEISATDVKEGNFKKSIGKKHA